MDRRTRVLFLYFLCQWLWQAGAIGMIMISIARAARLAWADTPHLLLYVLATFAVCDIGLIGMDLLRHSSERVLWSRRSFIAMRFTTFRTMWIGLGALVVGIGLALIWIAAKAFMPGAAIGNVPLTTFLWIALAGLMMFVPAREIESWRRAALADTMLP